MRLAISLLVLASPLAAQANGPSAVLPTELIRANTSNPAGNQRLIADVLAPKFRALGIETKIVPTTDSMRGVVVARVKGDGSKRPVLLAAHADVVGVEREKWSVDPFGASSRTIMCLAAARADSTVSLATCPLLGDGRTTA
jgi:acetylornithine deacetylase/succinyl-diaminopimelate desuccinylase-like protein